jgi:hypothetical protein
MNAIVNNFKILYALERRGYVILHGRHDDRERHWTGAKVRVIHVSEGPKLEHWYDEFEHRGQRYRLRYFDGCFHAFVTRVGAQLPAFV